MNKNKDKYDFATFSRGRGFTKSLYYVPKVHSYNVITVTQFFDTIHSPLQPRLMVPHCIFGFFNDKHVCE